MSEEVEQRLKRAGLVGGIGEAARIKWVQDELDKRLAHQLQQTLDAQLHCKRCGRVQNPVPGYESAVWQHCPCGGIAVRK